MPARKDDRWIAWARALASRRRRLPEAGRGPAMAVLHRRLAPTVERRRFVIERRFMAPAARDPRVVLRHAPSQLRTLQRTVVQHADSAPGAPGRDGRDGVTALITTATVRRLVEGRRREDGSRPAGARTSLALPGDGARRRAGAPVDPVTGWPLPVGRGPLPVADRRRPYSSESASPARAADAATGDRDAPPLDIERLADHVVRRIDQRIVAQRERLGRI